MGTWNITVNTLHCPFKLRFYGDTYCSYNHLKLCAKHNCLIKETIDEEVSGKSIGDNDHHGARTEKAAMDG